MQFQSGPSRDTEPVCDVVSWSVTTLAVTSESSPTDTEARWAGGPIRGEEKKLGHFGGPSVMLRELLRLRPTPRNGTGGIGRGDRGVVEETRPVRRKCKSKSTMLQWLRWLKRWAV